jgi:hypothetical protein
MFLSVCTNVAGRSLTVPAGTSGGCDATVAGADSRFASRLQPRSAHAGKDAKAFSTLVDGIKMLKDNPEVVTEELPLRIVGLRTGNEWETLEVPRGTGPISPEDPTKSSPTT